MESLTTAIESLKSLPVESTALIGISTRLNHLIQHIYTLYQSEYEYKQHTQGSNTSSTSTPTTIQHLNQLQDIVNNVTSHLSRLSSKGEFVEVLMRRSKAYEVLEQLEKRLTSSLSTIAYLEVIQGTNNGSSNNNKPIFQQYLEHIDILSSIDCLLYMKYLCEQSSEQEVVEHVGSIQILLSQLNQQRLTNMIKPLNSLDYWPIEENYSIAMRELLHLFPDRLLVEYEQHYKSDDSGLNNTFARSYRGLWSGKLIHIKKVARKNVFYRDELGLMEAIHCLHMNSKVIQDSPFLHQLLGVSWDQEQNFIYLISPLATYRSLFDVFSNPFLKPEEKIAISALEKVSIVLDITQGIHHLHQHGIYHGRLKDTNVLLYDGYRAKICDYGMDMFLTPETRTLCPGTHGLRFTPPEVVQQLQKLSELWQSSNINSNTSSKDNTKTQWSDIFKAINGSGKLTLESAIGIYGPFLSAFSTDIYAIGAIALVLLSEKQLFSNVAWENGVRAQLISGQIPMIPKAYPEQEFLTSFQEQVIAKTLTKSPHIRPASSALVQIVEKEYCDLALKIAMVDVNKYEEQMKQVEKEIAELDVKVIEHTELVAKGKELIARKDQEKMKIVDGKQRREHEANIEKARKKLIGFQDELEGLKEDKFGAEQDLDQLKELLQEAQHIAKRAKKHALDDRAPMPPPNSTPQDDLFDVYCSPRDAERFHQQIQSDQKNKGGPQRTKSISAAPTSPFVGTCQAIESLTPAQRSNMEKTLMECAAAEKTMSNINNRIAGFSGGIYCRLYKGLVDHHDLVFRAPIQSASSTGATRNPSLTPAAAASASVNLAFHQYQPATSPPPSASEGTYYNGGAASKYRMQTIPDSDDEDEDNDDRPVQYIKELDLVDSDDDDPVTIQSAAHHHQGHNHHTHHHHHHHQGHEDHDNAHDSHQPRDYNQRLISRATNATGFSRFTQAGLTSILQEVEKWVIPISEALTDGDDDFPSEEYDILHVQYLAAARGSWEEAVGMRRHNLGFSDEHVSILLEQQYTPIHLAAYLGNLKIFRQLVEDVGLPVDICDSNGESALHLACKRGHLSMIRYLIEECHLNSLQENSQGVTPVQYALKGGYLEVIVYFMEETPFQKLSFDFADSVLKGSLLHWACLGKRVELVEYLIIHQNIAVETIAESDQSTCLMWAALGSTVEVVKFLIESASADPNISNAQGWTCLHMATSSGDVDKTVYLLEQARLKITEKDANHKTPFEVATGAAAIYLQERKKKGFVSGSIVDKAKKHKSNLK